LNSSDMVAPMSVELVQPWIDSGLLTALPFDLQLRMDIYGIITRRQHQLTPAAQAMLAALREVVGAGLCGASAA
jgi:DNA-binding transcriptional LysR family regulator